MRYFAKGTVPDHGEERVSSGHRDYDYLEWIARLTSHIPDRGTQLVPPRSQMAMAGADPFEIMKAMGHTDIKMTMIYVPLGKSHIRDQVEKLSAIQVPLPPTSMPTFLPAPGSLIKSIP